MTCAPLPRAIVNDPQHTLPLFFTDQGTEVHLGVLTATHSHRAGGSSETVYDLTVDAPLHIHARCAAAVLPGIDQQPDDGTRNGFRQLLCRPEHTAATSRQCRGELTDRNIERTIPWDDQSDNTDRLQRRVAVVLRESASDTAFRDDVERLTVDLGAPTRVVLKRLGTGKYEIARMLTRHTIVLGFYFRQLFDALFDDLRGTPQNVCPPRRRQPMPHARLE